MISKYFKNFIKKGIFEDSIGCTQKEINKYYSGLRLPESYKEFLLLAGNRFNHYNEFFFGMNSIKDSVKLNYTLKNFTTIVFDVERKHIIFWEEEYGNRCIFKVNEGENPPVYIFSMYQSENYLLELTNSFTGFIDLLLKKGSIPKIYTTDAVKLKQMYRLKGEIGEFNEENNRFLDDIHISNNLSDRIAKDFEEEHKELVRKVVLDFAKEKAIYIHDKPEILDFIIDSVNGDLNKLNSLYFKYIIEHPNKDPSLLQQQDFM